MTERRALITWFMRCKPDHLSARKSDRSYHVASAASDRRAKDIAKLLTEPLRLLCPELSLSREPEGAVVAIGTNGEYLPSDISDEACLISTFCTAGAHLPQSDVPQHCHLPMNGITPQFG